MSCKCHKHFNPTPGQVGISTTQLVVSILLALLIAYLFSKYVVGVMPWGSV